MSNRGEDRHAGGLTDEALVRIHLDGPEEERGREAASELFGRYRRRVYLWCHRYVRDHERAMDLSQDVLLNAYKNLASFESGSRFGSWIYAIARNRCFNELRRPALFAAEEIDLDRIPDATREDPEEETIRRMDEDALLALIHENLDAQEQEVVWLRCFERMPVEMITQVLRIRQASGARGVLQRARRTLRAALDRRREAEGRERP